MGSVHLPVDSTPILLLATPPASGGAACRGVLLLPSPRWFSHRTAPRRAVVLLLLPFPSASDLQFHGFHGVKSEEKTLGQKFVVDVDAWMDLSVAGETDSISDTVSYTDIYGIAKDVVEGPSRNLLEAVAHRIASNALLKFPQISTIRVKVGKPHVAVRGIVDYLGVEILRHRKDVGGDRV
uniref:7,8-dihydroneopterin aldolase n=1 Tax=Oryza glumipatula TaxID=40148 RepID=A0A0E0A590_9ORYZ